MNKKTRFRLVPAALTLALVACNESITGIPDPVVEAAPVVEVAPTVALTTSGVCVSVTALPPLVSWWSGDDTFDDVAEPLDAANSIGFNSKAGLRLAPPLDAGDVTLEPGLVGKAFSFTSVEGGKGQFLEVEDAPDLQPQDFTIDLWAQRTGDGQNTDVFGSVLIQKALNKSPSR